LANKNFADDEDCKRYFSDRGWQARGSGKTLSIGESKVEILKDNELRGFTITNANYSWRQWLPVLGDFVKVDDNKFSLQYEGESIIFNVDTQADKEIISLRMPLLDKKFIKFLSLLKGILNKAAYCRNCRDCVIECPHGALTITADDVKVENCRHCYRCLDKPQGCLAAWSLMITGGENVRLEKLTDYRGFGFKKEWLKIFFDNPTNFDADGQLGKVMVDVFKFWGKHGGLLDKKNLPLAVVEKLISLGADSHKVWGYIFVNLAYNSNLMNLFVKSYDFNEPHDKNFLLEMFGTTHSDTTKGNALKALKATLRNTPIGAELGQGICELKGNAVISITRTAWQNPEPLVILYSLYQFAEHAENLYSFTLTDLLDDSDEREALSPKILFGLDEEILRPLLQGLSNDYPKFIRVEFNKGIQENIFLNIDKTLDDVIQLF
jgi:phosphoadenosine phosphosulfate reductase